MIYLDSAAVVKLVHAEPETPALRAWLDERAETGWLSSVLVEIETFRAVARYAPAAVTRLPPVLDQIDLIDLSPPHPHPGADGQASHGPVPGCHPPGHSPQRPGQRDLVRQLRQAPARRRDHRRIACRITGMNFAPRPWRLTERSPRPGTSYGV